MINVVIFSKDRACQLELLLRSFKRYFAEWKELNVTILFLASDEVFFKGYEKTIELHSEFNYIFEENFKENLYGLNFKYPQTMFLVDDNVFINKVSLKDNQFKLFEKNEDITCISLRMNPHVKTCYTQQQRMVKIPKLNDDLTWNWRHAAENDPFYGYPSDWGYPMSVDGHIFRTKDIINYIFSLNYNSPNTFEGILATKPINGNKMVCFNRSIIFNNPVNKVQNVNGNQAGLSISCSPEEINKKFLVNNLLKLDSYHNIDIFDPHQEEPLHFSNHEEVHQITSMKNVPI